MKTRSVKNEAAHTYVVGIDGGATKATAVLMDQRGLVKKTVVGKSISYHSVGAARAKRHLAEMVRRFIPRYPVRAMVIGFAGLDSREDFLVYDRMVQRIVPRGVLCVFYNDTKIALEDACQGERARLTVISGTGSNVYGEHGKKSARSGGWDYVLADEGSAYWFGMEAIRSAVRSFDGRSKKTLLEKLVMRRAGVRRMTVLITKITTMWQREPHTCKQYVASFSPVVDEAYQKGDEVARRIIEKGAEELFLAVRAVVERLRVRRARVCVGYAGSNFKAPTLAERLSRKIKALVPRAHFVAGANPARGAAKMALRIMQRAHS